MAVAGLLLVAHSGYAQPKKSTKDSLSNKNQSDTFKTASDKDSLQKANYSDSFGQKDTSALRNQNWQKSNSPTWKGSSNGKAYTYRMEKSSLQRSTDGKTWETVKDGVWTDNDGRWMRMYDNSVIWSDDQGKTWNDVINGQWQGTGNTWYRFDRDGNLWSTGATP